MTIFSKYADVYDAFNVDKDYVGEACFVRGLINGYHQSANSILELGCGTGEHAIQLVQSGYTVTGIDLSGEMVRQALKKSRDLNQGIRFFEADIRQLNLNQKFEVVYSLFHVLSYQNSNEDVIAMLESAKRHMKDGGILILDCWYGPAVLRYGPESRVKKIDLDGVTVTRFAEPLINTEKNIVEVSYTFEVIDNMGTMLDRYTESHSMRYFFLPELQFMLNAVGLNVVKFGAWMTDREPDSDSWGLYLVAKI